MSKVSLVVPNTSSTYLVSGITAPSGQGVLKSATSIPLITLCYPSTSYTLDSDMKIVGLYFRFNGASGYYRYTISTNNTFTFDSGSTTNMHCNFAFTLPLSPFGTPTFNIAAVNDLTAGIVQLNYSKVSTTGFELIGFDIAGYVNT